MISHNKKAGKIRFLRIDNCSNDNQGLCLNIYLVKYKYSLLLSSNISFCSDTLFIYLVFITLIILTSYFF